MIEALHADYERALAQSGYQGKFRKIVHTLAAPGFQAVAIYRISRWLMFKRIPILGALLQRAVEILTGISIPPETVIGPGLLIFHFGGVVINGDALIGKHCTLHHGVTIGNKNPGGPSPRIGKGVTIGAGAKVLGAIDVGDGAEIGANAVVIHSVPEGGVAVGVPAHIVRIKKELISVCE